MNPVCRKAIVSGKVQGVWYRASTKKRALQLGLTGWANNLQDGSVEVVMCGAITAIEKMELWLEQGPPLARVQRVDKVEMVWQRIDQFTTG